MSDFQLSIKPLKLSELPSEDVIIKTGQTLIESTKSWKQGKTHEHVVKTFSDSKHRVDGVGWHCRLSEHTSEDATFEEFWSGLGVNKAENEKEFITTIKKVQLVKQISPTQSIWTLYYTFPPPVSPRVFTVLQTTHLNEASPRSGMIISIPIDLSSPETADLEKLEEKGVRGRYTSVEALTELEGGKVEWRMAVQSRPGGNIPTFISEMTMAGKVSEDVPQFIKWNQGRRTKRNAVEEPVNTQN
ncbi:hypothetical protein C8Q75DRAFT_738930 [Abortiporus biennis]|nr:hypothetical protein C8Q75DRAFT_738930 [Abortiporus biennis]